MSANIHIDELPIAKSSKTTCWPILINTFEMPEVEPMTVSIFYGNGKPSILDKFLQSFVDELVDII